jgi:hypothetical protein
MRFSRLAGIVLIITSAALVNAQAPSPYLTAIPQSLRGPFVSDPAVVMLLECPTSACEGQLNFARLMQARSPEENVMGQNPFNLAVAAEILATVKSDLTDVRTTANATEGQLNPDFLTDPGSRVELVGAINRMDRQFIKDPTVGLSHAQLGCGEVSLIYRFSYSIRDGKQVSRLPVTLNMVFPALPSRTVARSVDCANIAQRWIDESRKPAGRTPQQQAADLLDRAHGPLAYIDGRDLIRLELNMQAYRKGASSDTTDFGTEAAYLIRVFKWDRNLKLFWPEFLRDTDRSHQSALQCIGHQGGMRGERAAAQTPDQVPEPARRHGLDRQGDARGAVRLRRACHPRVVDLARRLAALRQPAVLEGVDAGAGSDLGSGDRGGDGSGARRRRGLQLRKVGGRFPHAPQ